MHPNNNCPLPECPNRGILILDANFLLFLIEGTILYVQENFSDLKTNSERLPQIINELRNHLEMVRDGCSVNNTLYISDLVLFEEVVEVNPRQKGLIQLRKYSLRERRLIFRVLQECIPDPDIVSEEEVREFRGVFKDQDIRPDDRDSSLIIIACRLSNGNTNEINILTRDPDFIDPIKHLHRISEITLCGTTYSTNRISNRQYFNFILRLHDCCVLTSYKFSALIGAFYNQIIQRIPIIKREEVKRREIQNFIQLRKIHDTSLLTKE